MLRSGNSLIDSRYPQRYPQNYVAGKTRLNRIKHLRSHQSGAEFTPIKMSAFGEKSGR
jgi:hypothetical protein